MSLPNGSASATERLLACPGSLALARVSRTDGFAERGRELHAFVRAIFVGVPFDQALTRVTEEHRETARNLDWRALTYGFARKAPIRNEAAYALDIRARTARFLGLNIDRNYVQAAKLLGEPLGEWEIPGSIDIEGDLEDGRPVESDAKFGFHDVTPAHENGQLLFFAAVRHVMTGAPEVVGRILKIKPSGKVWRDEAVYTAFQLDDFMDRVEDALVQAKAASALLESEGIQPDVFEGEHCTYCPGANFCQAKTRLARSMLGDLVDVEGRIEAMTTVEAGNALELARYKIKPLLERVLDALDERAKREPLPLPDGKVARPIEYARENISATAALELARKLGATEEQLAECCRTTQIVQIRKTNDPNAKRAKKGKAA